MARNLNDLFLPGRRQQILTIFNHLLFPEEKIDNPPLFLFGGPSTGKTTTILHVVNFLERPFIYGVCQSSRDPHNLFDSILYQVAQLKSRSIFGPKPIIEKIVSWREFHSRLKTQLFDLHLSEPIYIIIDDMECLQNLPKATPKKRKRPNGKLLLDQLFDLDRSLGIPFVNFVFISKTALGRHGHLRVHFPPYTDEDAGRIFRAARHIEAESRRLLVSANPRPKHRFRYSLRHIYPRVYHQLGEGICFPTSTAQVMSTIYRMVGDDKHIDLSPQPLIQRNCLTVDKIRFNVTNRKCGGLQRAKDDPFVHIAKKKYRYQKAEKFYLDDIKVYSTLYSIKRAIIYNFSPIGPRFPLIGGCRMGDLAYSHVAEYSYFFEAFSHNMTDKTYVKELKDDTGHVVVITGVDLTSDDPKDHSVEIKNSWGPWGAGGFTHVKFNFFSHLFVPVLHHGEVDDASFPLESLGQMVERTSDFFMDRLVDDEEEDARVLQWLMEDP